MSAPTFAPTHYSQLVAGVIRRRAAAADLTIPQLAEVSGIPAGRLEKQLTDGPLRLLELELIAESLHVRTSDLLTEAERVSRPLVSTPLLLDIPLPGWAHHWDIESPDGAAAAERWADRRGVMMVRLEQSIIALDAHLVEQGTVPFRLAWDQPVVSIGFEDRWDGSSSDRLSFEITLEQARAGWAELSPYPVSAQEIADAQTQIDELLARYDAAPTVTSRDPNASDPKQVQAMAVTDQWLTLAIGQASFDLTRDDAVAVWEALEQALRQMPGRGVRPLSERVPNGQPIQANAARF